jgi:hypothetical protein
MIRDLDDTLKAILDDPASPTELRNADVSFEAPDKSFAPAQATVNLFLYEVKENRELRTCADNGKGRGYLCPSATAV